MVTSSANPAAPPLAMLSATIVTPKVVRICSATIEGMPPRLCWPSDMTSRMRGMPSDEGRMPLVVLKISSLTRIKPDSVLVYLESCVFW